MIPKNALGAALAMGLASLTACADDNENLSQRQQQQQQLVDRATLTVQDVLDYRQNGGEAQRFLRQARGVMICPSVFKMGFIFGGSGGGCVLLARDGSGSWSAPAFYSMGSGSFGAQIGIQDAELVMFVMTQKGLRAIMDSQFKFGADAGVSLATLGAGMEGATTAAMRADIVAVAKSKGLYAGLSLQGSMLSSDSLGDRAYYGQPVGPEDIAVAMRVNNPGADPLRAALMRFGAAPSPGAPPAYRPAATGYAPQDQGAGPMQIAPTGGVQSEALPPPR